MELKFTLAHSGASQTQADAVVLLAWEGTRHADIEKSFAGLYEAGEITGKVKELTLLHAVPGFAASRVLLTGLGKREKFDGNVLRKVAGTAARFLKDKGLRTIAFVLDPSDPDQPLDAPEQIAAVAEAAALALWEPDVLKTEKDSTSTVSEIIVATANPDVSPSDKARLATVLEQSRIVSEAACLARDISVQPPNLLTPLNMAERARRVAAEGGLSCDVLDRERMKQLGMGALLGVAQGSAEPPALIVLQYKPENATSGDHLALIGKGVTFDTGGISIKPSDGMEKMKYDMAAGAAVIAAMQAIARLKPGVAVTGIVPAVENMPGSRAQRPGDIVTSLSGKTIEVLNTDAEGRLILADAITWAKQLGCTHLVDAATLTGAVVVALGTACSGVFANDEQLLERWMTASKDAGERMWHMPLYDDYREQLKTVYADIGNIGGRWGGACTAAIFLKEFVGETPWIHVDVAGTAWLDDAKSSMAKGPTGIPVGSFIHLVLNWK